MATPWPFFSPFGYGRVPELFRMTNILNGNNLEGMTIIIQIEWYGESDGQPYKKMIPAGPISFVQRN